MNNINSIYGINNSYLPVFRKKEVNNTAATNPISSNVSMKGMDALANYNKSETSTNKFNIPALSPVDIPEDVNQVEGEKTYDNATGETIIIQKDSNIIKRYTYEKNGSYTYEVLDSEDNLLFLQGKNITPNGTYIKVIKEQNDNNKTIGLQTLYKDGILEHVSQYITPSKESDVGYPYENIGYNALAKTYYVQKCDSNNKILTQYFDNNLKPISPEEYKIKNLLTNKNYMETTHGIQVKRDIDGDGEISVDETLANNYLMRTYPELGEEDRNVLIKYAKEDGNINVSDEEFVRWLESPEHAEILEEFKIREAEEIKAKRENTEN